MNTLKEALDEYGDQALLITANSEDLHVSHVIVDLQDGKLHGAIGKSATQNIESRDNITLLWSPRTQGDYSLIMDAKASLNKTDELTHCWFTISRAVLHRAGDKPQDSLGPCASDCRPIRLEQSTG